MTNFNFYKNKAKTKTRKFHQTIHRHYPTLIYSETHRPLFVMTISVPSLWNFSQSSLPSRVTLGSSTTPSSSGGGGTRCGWGPARGWCPMCGDGGIIPGGRGGLSCLIPPGTPAAAAAAPWWWRAAAAAAASTACASSVVCGPRPSPDGRKRSFIFWRILSHFCTDTTGQSFYEKVIF